MDIGKAKDNYNKDGRPKYFNCNKYGHMAKECQKKKENNIRRCFKCEQVGHITKNYKEKQLMKNRSMSVEVKKQEKLDIVKKTRFQKVKVTRKVYSKDII